MFKNFVLAAVLAVFTGLAIAAGPAQIFRIDITGAEDGVVEIADIEFRATAGGASLVDLFRNYTFEEASPAGATTWSITHSLGIQVKTAEVTYIANAVDVVAPGDYFHHTGTGVLSVREPLAYVEVDYITAASGPTGSEPGSPVAGDFYYDTTLGEFTQFNGAAWASHHAPVDDEVYYDTIAAGFNIWAATVWVPLTPTATTSALPIPDSVTADTITWLPSGALPAAGGPALNNDVELTFPQAVVGAATIRGASFDTPGSNRPASAVPIIEGFERRPAAAVFDGNKASKLKSKRAPTFRSPMQIQYTFWVGDPSRYPNIVEYTITAPKQLSAPKSWTVMLYIDGQWVQVDQQAAMRFEDGETRVFSID